MEADPRSTVPVRTVARWGLLFGGLAFCQGIGEPGDGLIAQPTLSLLKRWGHGPGSLGSFSMAVGLAWILKPIFGLLTDFVPLAGRKRQGYLMLAGILAFAPMLGLSILPIPPDRFAWLLGWLTTSTLAWSFADVVADALLIDRGRELGLVGRFQAVQWASSYGAGLIAGVGGGWLSQHAREYDGFQISGLAAIGTVLLADIAVRDFLGVGGFQAVIFHQKLDGDAAELAAFPIHGELEGVADVGADIAAGPR